MYLRVLCTDPYYFGQVSEFARTFVSDQVNYIRGQFEASNSEYRDYVLAELQKIEDKIPDLKYPFED